MLGEPLFNFCPHLPVCYYNYIKSFTFAIDNPKVV